MKSEKKREVRLFVLRDREMKVKKFKNKICKSLRII